jgi:F-type H+-transporting ATPase subunit b
MSAENEVAHVIGPGLPELITLINLFLLTAFLVLFTRKGISSFFQDRSVSIRARLETSKRELAEVEQKISETQGKLADFEGLKRKMIEDVRREAHALSDKIVADAERAAKQVLVDARLAAEQESREAIDAIREKLILEALKNVQEQLARDPLIREKMHDSMVENFATQLQGSV